MNTLKKFILFTASIFLLNTVSSFSLAEETHHRKTQKSSLRQKAGKVAHKVKKLPGHARKKVASAAGRIASVPGRAYGAVKGASVAIENEREQYYDGDRSRKPREIARNIREQSTGHAAFYADDTKQRVKNKLSRKANK